MPAEAPGLPHEVAAGAAAAGEGGGALQKLQLSGVEDHRRGNPSPQALRARAAAPCLRPASAPAGSTFYLRAGWVCTGQTQVAGKGDSEGDKPALRTVRGGNGHFHAPMRREAGPRAVLIETDLQNSSLRKNTTA